MEWLRKNWAILITIAGLVGTWSTTQFRLDIQDEKIADIKNRQNTSEQLLSDINSQLSSLNSKVDLIISGKIITKE